MSVRRRRRTSTGFAFAFVEGFDSNTAASYTTGGDAAATWTYNTAQSRLESSGGAQAWFSRTGFSSATPVIEADYDQIVDGGLIIHLVDNNNYYLVTISDDTQVPSGVNIAMYKRVASTFTQLGTGSDLSIPRGTLHTDRLAREGGNIVYKHNTVSILSVADATFVGANPIALRNNVTGTTQWYRFAGGSL